MDYEQAYLDKYYRFDDGDGRLYWRADITGAGTTQGESGSAWKGSDPTRIGRHWALPTAALEALGVPQGASVQQKLDALETDGRIYWPERGSMPQIKRYRDELRGKTVPDIWDDIDRINPVGAERLGYPTQKPVALLERIIAVSSNEGNVVLDPFCGCGTAIAAAANPTLNRRWIGIDITHLAINLIKHRLKGTYGDAVHYTVIGEPVSLPDAASLAQENPYQFQWWALGLVGARPAQAQQKKGADRGIDGRLYFHDEGPNGDTKQIVFSVKAGQNVGPQMVRDLAGVLNAENAQIGVLISMQAPTQPMRAAAASAGFYHSPGWGQNYPRVQLLTVAELLAGKRIDYPPAAQVNVTFKKAPKAKNPAGVQTMLPVIAD